MTARQAWKSRSSPVPRKLDLCALREVVFNKFCLTLIRKICRARQRVLYAARPFLVSVTSRGLSFLSPAFSIGIDPVKVLTTFKSKLPKLYNFIAVKRLSSSGAMNVQLRQN